MHNAPYASTEFFITSPCQALGKSAQTYARELAHELGSSEEMVACTLLAMFAAGQLGAECVVKDGYVIPLSLYLAIGAAPSAGKSPIVARMLPVLESLIDKHVLLSAEEERKRRAHRAILEKRIRQETKNAAKLSSAARREEAAELIASLEEELASLPIPCSPIMGDMSIHAFVKELSVRNGRGICINAEGSILTELNTVATSQLSPLLRAWSREPIEDITKKEQFRATTPFVVMMAMWQIDPLLQIFRNASYRGVGLTARFLPYIEGQPPRAGHGQVSLESECWYTAQLESVVVRANECLNLSGSAPRFQLSAGAQSVFMRFKEYVLQLQGHMQPFEKFQDIAGKLESQAVRLATPLHAMGSIDPTNMVIDEETMKRGCNLALFFAFQSAKIIDRANWDKTRKEAQQLMETIAAYQASHPYGGFTVDELRRPHGLSKATCDRLLFWLSSNNWIDPGIVHRPLPTGGCEQVETWVPRYNFAELL